MPQLPRVLGLALITSLASLCASCGGGGGGGPPSFSLSTASVSFSATNNGAVPANQTVTATAANGTVYFSINTTGNALATATLSCSGSTCQIVLVPVAPVGLGSGTLASTVVVTGCTASVGCGSQVQNSPQTINVSYVISPGPVLSSNPGALGLQTTPTTAPQPQMLGLASTMAAAWTSSVTYLAGGSSGWLSVPGSGNAPGNVSVGVGTLPVGAYRAQVTFTPTGGGGSTTVTVVAVSHNPGLRYVSPYVSIAGIPQPAILRGSGFASLSAAQAQVLFGATPGGNVTVVNDTEIDVLAPALATGAYPITVKDNSQTLPGNATLAVVSAPGYAYAKIPRAANTDSVSPGHLIYDAARGAIYLYDANASTFFGGQYADEIERYRFNAGAWASDVLYAFSPLGQQPMTGNGGSLSLAADGTTLVRTGYSTVDQVDPVAGTLLATTAVSDTFTVGGYAVFLGLGTMTNSGMLLGTAHLLGPVSSPPLPGFLFYYDVPTQAFLPAPAAPSGAMDIANYSLTGSLDGSTVLMTEGLALPTAFLIYDNGSGTFPISGGLGTLISSEASLTSGGSRALMHADSTRYAVVDFSGGMSNLRGYLPLVADAVVISPDGTRGFAFVASTTTVHVYDLTAAVNGNAEYPEIGTGLVLPDAPSASGTDVDMIITPDGGTLILGGTTNVIVTAKPPG